MNVQSNALRSIVQSKLLWLIGVTQNDGEQVERKINYRLSLEGKECVAKRKEEKKVEKNHYREKRMWIFELKIMLSHRRRRWRRWRKKSDKNEKKKTAYTLTVYFSVNVQMNVANEWKCTGAQHTHTHTSQLIFGVVYDVVPQRPLAVYVNEIEYG